MIRGRACAGALLMLVGALSAATLLLRLGSALPWPEGLSRAQVDTWLRDEGAVRASFALARAGGLGLAAYMALLAALALVAALSGAAVAARIVLRVALPSLRPVVAPIAAITLTVTTAVPAFAQGRDQPTPVMQLVASPDSNPPMMRLVPVVAPAAAAPVSLPTTTHTVAPGDTFWSIAEDVVRGDARSTSDDDVVSYWRALIDVNRDRLRVPGEPDLIFPGQVFELPPLS
jgi:nucleoid-associated protein YgaU